LNLTKGYITFQCLNAIAKNCQFDLEILNSSNEDIRSDNNLIEESFSTKTEKSTNLVFLFDFVFLSPYICNIFVLLAKKSLSIEITSSNRVRTDRFGFICTFSTSFLDSLLEGKDDSRK
jgi:hypothetical protein